MAGAGEEPDSDPYEAFLDAVVDHGRAAGQFWLAHDLPDVLERWGAALSPDRVHVVTVPQRGAAPGLLLDRFCQVLGVDSARLDRETNRANTSIGLVQAELMRRVNLSLGDLLPLDEPGYGLVGKRLLGEDVLAAQGGRPPPLPGSMERWCRETAEHWRETITDRGYDLVGDLDDLLPDPSAFADELPEVADGDLVDSAAQALATMLERMHTQRQETRRLRQELRTTQRDLRAARGSRVRAADLDAAATGTPSEQPKLLRRAARAVRGRR